MEKCSSAPVQPVPKTYRTIAAFVASFGLMFFLMFGMFAIVLLSYPAAAMLNNATPNPKPVDLPVREGYRFPLNGKLEPCDLFPALFVCALQCVLFRFSLGELYNAALKSQSAARMQNDLRNTIVTFGLMYLLECGMFFLSPNMYLPASLFPFTVSYLVFSIAVLMVIRRRILSGLNYCQINA